MNYIVINFNGYLLTGLWKYLENIFPLDYSILNIVYQAWLN